MVKQIGSRLANECHKAIYLAPYSFNLHTEYILRKAVFEEDGPTLG